MLIGINSFTANNDFNIIKNLKDLNLIDTYECSIPFYNDYYHKLDSLDLQCSALSSIIQGSFDLTKPYDRYHFTSKLLDAIKIAKNIGTNKLMFGLAKYRSIVNNDIIKFFEELFYIAQDENTILLYEAISNKAVNNNFITNHHQLIALYNKLNCNTIHVDFGTLYNEHEIFENIVKQKNVINIHYPIHAGSLKYALNHNISLENYTNTTLSERNIIDLITNLRK